MDVALQHPRIGKFFYFNGLTMKLDSTDLQILALLQEDAALSVADIASKVNLSQTPCWRRIQKMQESGIIRRRVALIDPAAIGLSLTVFVEIIAESHSREWLDRFAATVRRMPAVMEVHRMAGDIDYVLRVCVANMEEFDGFYQDLITAVPMTKVTSRVAMEQVKWTTAYPIKGLRDPTR
jgi:Lrp/AsnC family transcriptional regulator